MLWKQEKVQNFAVVQYVQYECIKGHILVDMQGVCVCVCEDHINKNGGQYYWFIFMQFVSFQSRLYFCQESFHFVVVCRFQVLTFMTIYIRSFEYTKIWTWKRKEKFFFRSNFFSCVLPHNTTTISQCRSRL